MLQISRRSWHYRVYEAFGALKYRPTPKNLCRYFWTTVVTALFFLAIAICLAGLALYLTVGIVVGLILHWWKFVEPGIFMWIILLLFAVGIGLGVWVQHRVDRRAGLPPKAPGPVRAYLKARKAKVCPMITVVD